MKNQISVAGKVLNKVESLIKKYDSVEILDLQMLILQIGREMSIAMKGEADGLQVMGLLETRNLDFDVVNMLSVNEGVIPKNKNSCQTLSDCYSFAFQQKKACHQKKNRHHVKCNSITVHA